MKTVADSTAIFSLQPGISLPRPQLMPIDLTTVTKKPKWSQVKQPNVNQSNISSAVDSTVFGMRKADLGNHYNIGKDRYQVECDQNYYASKLLVRNDSSILICNGIDYLVNQSETQQTSSVELNYRERGTNILSGDMEWIFGLSLLVFIIIGAVRITASQYISALFSFLYSERDWGNVLASISLQNRQPSILLWAAFNISLSLCIYEIFTVNQISPLQLSGFKLWASLWVCCMLLYWLRIFAHFCLGLIFNLHQRMSYVFKCTMMASNVMGMLMLPIAFLFPFVSANSYLMLTKAFAFVFILMYLWHVVKSAAIFLVDYISILYFILYFCIVEIVPILLFYAILIK